MNSDDTRTKEEQRASELLDELRSLHTQGKLPPESPFRQTVGGMIWRAREKKGISRAHLAKVTGISQNSLAKYEKAGEEDGQYPPLPKMALLCKELELDPRIVFRRTFSFEVINDDLAPDLFAFDDFLHTLDVDDFKLHRARIVSEEMGEIVQKYRVRQGNYKTTISRLEKQVQELTNELNKQNGPNQNDPSRPEKPKNNAETVSAVSTNPKKKGKTDEAV